MRYHIEKLETGFSIRIDDVAGQEQAVLETIRQCRRQSVWACPSGECQNIGSMKERAEGGSVFLTLTPTPGAEIALTGIDECLRYVLHQAVKVYRLRSRMTVLRPDAESSHVGPALGHVVGPGCVGQDRAARSTSS